MAQHEDDKHEEETERREVRSADPSLSPRANELLTEELREVIGTDTVDVPVSTPRSDHDRHADHGGLLVVLAGQRLLVGIVGGVCIVVLALVTLATAGWGLMIAAIVILLTALAGFITVLLQMSTQVEHVSPDVSVELEDEGVADPDRLLSDLLEEYSGEPDKSGPGDIVTPGNNEDDIRAGNEPAASHSQQRTAQTPASDPTTAAPGGDS